MASDPRLTTFAIRHQIYLERLKTGKVRDFLSVMRESDATIKRLLTGAGVGKLNELSRTQLANLINDLTIKQGEIFSRATGEFLDSLPALAVYEAEHEARTLREVADKKTQQRITIPSAKQLHDESMARPVQAFGKRVADVTKDWADSAIEQVNGAVRVAYEQGLTVPEVMKQILGSAQLGYKDGKGEISRRTAATIVRTGIQQVASTARQVTYEENSDLVKGYEWVSTLDGKTSVKCRSLDGQKFKLEDGPLPPIHPNCRSTTTPDLGDEFKFLDKGATRSSQDGYMDANTTYYDFLKKQSPEFQDGVLGEIRGKLFREGGLTVDRFRELQLDRNFEPMTLEQMRELEPKAFERAGLSSGPLGLVQAPSDVPSPNRPKAGTATGKVWDTADALQKELGRMPTRQEVMARGRELGINDSTIGVQFGKWRTATGTATLGGTVPTPATAVAQAITKLTESVEALTPSAGSSQARWAEIQNQLKNVASGTLTPEQRNKHKTAVRIMENLRASRPDGKGGIAEDKLDDSTKKAYLRALTNFKEVTGNDFTFGTSSFVSNGRTAVHKLLEKVNAPKKQFKIKDAPEISQIIVQKTRSAAEFLSNVTSDRFKDNAVDLIEIDAGSREGYMRSFMSIRASTDTTNSTFVHELAHHIEYETFTKSKTPGSLKRITEFLKKRQGTEPRKARAKEFPNEMVFEDEWVKRGGTNYSSRVYGDATEVITTGAERLFNDPVEFYRKDPEHFEITTRTLLDLW